MALEVGRGTCTMAGKYLSTVRSEAESPGENSVVPGTDVHMHSPIVLM